METKCHSDNGVMQRKFNIYILGGESNGSDPKHVPSQATDQKCQGHLVREQQLTEYICLLHEELP